MKEAKPFNSGHCECLSDKTSVRTLVTTRENLVCAANHGAKLKTVPQPETQPPPLPPRKVLP
jgi:hypothetical protein